MQNLCQLRTAKKSMVFEIMFNGLFLTSNFSTPNSEGNQKTFYNIASHFLKKSDSRAITLTGKSFSSKHKVLDINRLFISYEIKKELSWVVIEKEQTNLDKYILRCFQKPLSSRQVINTQKW